jgi:hypothetical protein
MFGGGGFGDISGTEIAHQSHSSVYDTIFSFLQL